MINGLENIVERKELVATKVDNGNTIVLLMRSEYTSKGEKFVTEGQYKEVNYDYTSKFQASIRKLMREIIFISEYEKLLVESKSPVAKFKSQVKLRKEGLPIRPIVSFIITLAYRISKEVSNILKGIYQFDKRYSVENNIKLVDKFKEINVNENMTLLSLDIKDMYTNIDVNKTMELIEKNDFRRFEHKEELGKIIKECLHKTYFRFNNKYYMQEEVSRRPMGSSLFPILAEIFMNNFEKELMRLTNYKGRLKLWVT